MESDTRGKIIISGLGLSMPDLPPISRTTTVRKPLKRDGYALKRRRRNKIAKRSRSRNRRKL